MTGAANLTLAVIEDEEDCRELLAELLEQAGHAALRFSDGASALAALRSGLAVDAIFLDLMMPVMNGWQFLAAQRTVPELRGIPVIVISASSVLSSERLEGVLAEFEKPVDFRQILPLLDRLGAGSAAGGA